MKILIDTNVLLDFLQQRESFAEAEEILSLCGRNKVQGFVAAHSFPNMFFILRKYMDSAKRRDLLFYLTSLLGVVSIDYLKILSALSRADFNDFEDCLQDECAAEIKADFIVTRNTDDFKNSMVPAITPAAFLKIL